eukprot:6209977-Pleurochrysis_carterae.AAC.1
MTPSRGSGCGSGIPADGGTKPAGRPMFKGRPASSNCADARARREQGARGGLRQGKGQVETCAYVCA